MSIWNFIYSGKIMATHNINCMSELYIPEKFSLMPVLVKDSRDSITSKLGSEESAQSPKLDRDSTIFSPEMEKQP